MNGLSSISTASLTALSALDKLSNRIGQIAENVASDSGSENLAANLTELPQVGIAYQANLFVLQKVQEMSQDLILQPRR